MKTILALIALIVPFPALPEESAYEKGYNDYMEMSDRFDRIHRDSEAELDRVQDQLQRWDEEETNKAARDFYERDRIRGIYGRLHH